ncbi:unnamed protein product [Allacma fusca]|uniref:Uncharacterized protein n=1 Tax=Allacma fusca TaxID=39272 RepID=A0A8J2K1K8_9HEXA|nr:unnamed protein product [Allacma fusca]
MPYIIKYFNFWLKAVHTMNIDATQAAVVPALVGIGFAIVITGLFVPASFVKALPSLCGMPASIAIIVGRDFLPGLMEPVNPSKRSFGGLFDALYIFGICLHAYLMMSSYFFVLLCMTVCKYLRNAFLMWNGRVYSSLLRGGDYIHSKEGRSTYALLYKDHATLLDLVEGTDRVFVYILESFTGLSILSLCLELYFIIRTAQKGYSEKAALEGGFFVRKHDWIAGGILTIQHGVMLIMALRITSSVGEEAMAGLEIIRRKTMLGRKADEELYFMLSMFSSYTSDNPIALCGGGFFVCNKEYIIGVVATIISYFTLVFQFEPQLDFNPTAGVDTSREKIQEFIDRLERPLLWDP